MVASDAEWGLGMRLDSTRSFPRSLTLAATRNPELVRRFGQIVGVSLKRTGVHVNFAPVVDVNSNSINPVIGSRSFGENVELVGELGLAYALGLQDVNVLATAKHFPGHGDSDSDSHKTLPTISGDKHRLDSVELAPFRVLIDGGIGAMMIAHLDVPALDSTESQPSTLSPTIVDTLLRQKMGFEGLAFTDALSMKGFVDFAGDRPRARDALLAGNDILLFPGDPVKVIEEISNAIKEGTLDSALVTEKCKRVLLAKVWTDADAQIPSKGTEWEPHDAEQVHREILEESMTLLANRSNTLPWLAPEGEITLINISDKAVSGMAYTDHLQTTLGRSYQISSYSIGKDASGWGRNDVIQACLDADLVIVNFLESNNRQSQNYGISPTAVEECSQKIRQAKQDTTNQTKWVVNVFANPYCLNEDWAAISEGADGLVMAYQDDYRTQETAADVLSGVSSANGLLPVTPPGSMYREGDGLGLPCARGTRLGWDQWSCDGNWGPAYQIDSIVSEAIRESAMPGCRVVVAHKGRVMHDGVYGTTDGRTKVEE
ncbi:MAG: glycoside hydrolase family 3 N-terminal domain-containing protein, partial [Flavobacteriales bacterium]